MTFAVRCCALVGALFGFAALPAAADDAAFGAIGISLNPIVGGVHESFNDTIHLPPLPVPLLEADGRFANFEIYAYGWAPPVSIPYSNAVQGQVGLRLTILNATFRVWDGKHRFAIGVGETLYNQTTHYAAADVYAPSGDEQQYSRIAGAHYEVDARMPYRAGAIETYVSYAPVLLGTQVSAYGDGSPTRFDPERGEQIEANVRYLRAMGRHAFAELGMRYVNFTAAYDVPGKPLSDRNAALLPSIGYFWKL
jgi:hypothetical protein